MNKNILKSAMAAAALLIATSALAQQAAPAKPAAARAPTPAAGPDAVFAAWDKNKDGALSKEEFNNGWTGTRDTMALQRLHAEFERRDVNKSGKLEASEYATLAIVQRAGKSAPSLTAFDRNKDSGLDFPEYVDFIRTSMKNAQPQASATPAPAAKK